MSKYQNDNQLVEALWRPWLKADMTLAQGCSVWFMGAEPSTYLQQYANKMHPFVLSQHFYPTAMALEKAGFAVREVVSDERFDLVMLQLPRPKDIRRIMLAKACSHLGVDGKVLTAVSNKLGAASVEKDLRRLMGDVAVETKHKCRIMAAQGDKLDMELVHAWLALDELQTLPNGYVTRPGLFAWDRIDSASRLLASSLPTSIQGDIADLGAGFGYLATELVSHHQGVTSLDLYEADYRALPAARANLDRACRTLADAPRVGIFWHDVCMGLDRKYDHIVMNPPFHQGRADAPELGRAFIKTAAQALRKGGCLWMVANQHLAYENTLDVHFERVQILQEAEGFKVMRAWR